MNRKLRTLVAACLILLLLLALPLGLTYRKWQQARLDHALALAVKDNRLAEISRLLTEGANPNAANNPVPTFTEMLRALLSRHTPSAPVQPSIVSAALGQHWDVVDVLLAHGADVNAHDDRGMTLLHCAALSQDQKWFLATSNDPHKKESIELGMPRLNALLERHPKVNARDRIGQTPLHYAAEFEDGPFVEALLAAGSDVDAMDRGGGTPLANATRGLHFDTAKVLLAHGADINHKDKRGGTMLNYAKHFNGPQMVAFLKRNGAK